MGTKADKICTNKCPTKIIKAQVQISEMTQFTHY